jgi:hypothetical protein
LIVTQPSKNETTVQQNSPDVREGRMSLAAYLAAGIGLAGITGAADAAIVNIDLTDTRGDGNTTTDDNISGLNAGLSANGSKTINDWLGSGTGVLELYRGYGGYWGMDGDSYNLTSLQFLTASSAASPVNLSSGYTIDGTAGGTWTENGARSAFKSPLSTSADFGANSYMGFRLSAGPFAIYGWLEVTWNGTTQDWQILSGAYENTINTAINAGQGAPSVPAPSPASLLALIVGGAALRQWRAGRRKQQLLEQTAA